MEKEALFNNTSRPPFLSRLNPFSFVCTVNQRLAHSEKYAHTLRTYKSKMYSLMASGSSNKLDPRVQYSPKHILMRTRARALALGSLFVLVFGVRGGH